jgi:hypothetical protein
MENTNTSLSIADLIESGLTNPKETHEVMRLVDTLLQNYLRFHDGLDGEKVYGSFMYKFARYLTWSNATNFQVDHLLEDGRFGILMYGGGYTCMVMMREDGHSSGHS